VDKATGPHIITIWWLAIRPKTLSLSWVPVLVSSSLAFSEQGQFSWLVMLTAVLAAILIQIGTNLHNDAKDFERGVDRPDRQGPVRVTAIGWLQANQVRNAAYMAFGLAFIIGLYLIWIGGWIIFILGIASIVAGLAYTGGPRPIAYGMFGEIFVFLFFGVAAVVGTYYLHTHQISWTSMATGAAFGLLAAAVLTVNNYRDIYSDKLVGKITLPIYIGEAATRIEYAGLMILPFVLIIPSGIKQPWALILAYLTLPGALWLVIRFFKTPPSPACNDLLARTAQLQLIFGLLLGIGYLI